MKVNVPSTKWTGDKTPVIFRKWPKSEGGGVIALFPTIPADWAGRYCQSYEHVGQHGGADYHGVVRQTTPAKPDEYADLASELTGIGYDLVPYSRATPAMHVARRVGQ